MTWLVACTLTLREVLRPDKRPGVLYVDVYISWRRTLMAVDFGIKVRARVRRSSDRDVIEEVEAMIWWTMRGSSTSEG